jgi:electron transfer flavoprotein beta subunit
MRAVVCLKQVVDPLTPATELALDRQAWRMKPATPVPPVINGYDEQALEAALRLREQLVQLGQPGQLEIVALSVGERFTLDVMKRALAVGADQLVLVQDPSLDTPDSHRVAAVLAAAIRKLGPVDLVLCGRQASDWDNALVPLLLADRLGLPCLTLARKVSVQGTRLEVDRVLGDGSQLMWSELPALVTVTSELGALRMPTARARLATARIQPKQLTLADLGIGPAEPPAVEVRDLAIPVAARECRFIEAPDGAGAGRRLAEVLMAAGVVRAEGGA